MTIKDLQKRVVDFRDARDWKKYHKPKDVAISLILETAELLEHFQWKTDADFEEYKNSPKYEKFREEIADVANYLLLLAHDLDVDLESELLSKIDKNDKKYPIEKIKGNYKKYTEL